MFGVEGFVWCGFKNKHQPTFNGTVQIVFTLIRFTLTFGVTEKIPLNIIFGFVSYMLLL